MVLKELSELERGNFSTASETKCSMMEYKKMINKIKWELFQKEKIKVVSHSSILKVSPLKTKNRLSIFQYSPLKK